MRHIDINIEAFTYRIPDAIKEISISESHQKKMRSGVLSLDKSNKYYPTRSDEKVMRTDVIASILIISEMLEQLNIKETARNELALLVANSTFIEEKNKNMNRALNVLNKIKDFKSISEKLTAVYKNTPPLLALETLTNSTMSFIAQYTSIKGNNTTFGSTSHSALDALIHAKMHISSDQSKKVVVGGSNCGGQYSFLANQNFYTETDDWLESACSSFFLIGKDGDIKITKMEHNYHLPQLNNPTVERNWHQLLNNLSPKFIIYSGGFTNQEFIDNEKEVKRICPKYFTWETQYGNLGSSAIFMNMAYGCELIKADKYLIVDILNRDVYGRESHIRIEKR